MLRVQCILLQDFSKITWTVISQHAEVNKEKFWHEKSKSATTLSCFLCVSHILWILRVYFHVHKIPPPLHTQSQRNSNSAPWRYILVLFSHPFIGLVGNLCSSDFSTNTVYAFFFPHMFHMPSPSHPPWFYFVSDNCWGLQLLGLFIMHFYPVSCYFLLHRSKYIFQRPVTPLALAHGSLWEIQFHTCVNNRQNYSSVFFILLVFRYQTRRKTKNFYAIKISSFANWFVIITSP